MSYAAVWETVMEWIISPTIIQEERAKQHLLEQEKLSCLGNSVASFIEAAPHMAFLKEAQTGVYINVSVDI